ncbi:MAG: catalase [Clostridia bacterium]
MAVGEFDELIKKYSKKMLELQKNAQRATAPKPLQEKINEQEPIKVEKRQEEKKIDKRDILTDSLGRKIPNDTNSQTVSNEGPTLMQDIHFIDKMAHFDRERIPERVVHAKGAGAFGEFVCYEDMGSLTSADFLNEANKKTPVFVRFSTVIGSKGSADTVRDPRGFAVKFYTNDGIYDITGNDLPVFFIRDAIKFPDIIHSLKPDPVTNLQNPERFWDFISLTPESTHMITWLYSDRGTIKSYRNVDGFGVNTYVWVNKNNERKYIKYHFKTQQGIKTIDRHEATELAGVNPNIAVEDLYAAIESKNYPQYELCVQVMDKNDAADLTFDPLDDTKIWPEESYPLIKVGMLTLNKNPDNFFAQVEQSAFCPGNLVNGVELSFDKMLQGRSFSYLDAQRYRLGTNFAQLPINRPNVKINNNQRDGAMDFMINSQSINYSPNSLNANVPVPMVSEEHIGPFVEGNIVRAPIDKTDDFEQAGEHYLSLSKEEQNALADNIAIELFRVKPDIKERVLSNFRKANVSFFENVIHYMKMYIERI